jgi:hypothetical protein
MNVRIPVNGKIGKDQNQIIATTRVILYQLGYLKEQAHISSNMLIIIFKKINNEVAVVKYILIHCDSRDRRKAKHNAKNIVDSSC